MARVRFVLGALAAVVWATPLYSQNTGSVQGRVTDAATAQPLSGVTLTIGSRSALTNLDGHYFITNVPAGTDSVRARILGYAPMAQLVTVEAGQTATADFAMTAKAVSLGEMVVIGYGQQSAGNLTGAVTQVNAEKFNPGRIVSPAQLVQNKVPGVEVVDNNTPGGGLAIRIRGTTSVDASSEPLYIIDGQPIGSAAGSGPGGVSINGQDPLNMLNPDDIESMTVLRDASAAAIYGTNGANGVVIITTKSGKSGPHFEYSGSVSGSVIDRTPSMLSAAQFRSAVQFYDSAKGTNIESQLLNANTDWFSQVDQNAIGQDHNFAFSGTGPTTNYRLSFGYMNQDGVMRRTNLQRLTLGMNVQQRLLSDHLLFQGNLKAYREADTFTPGDVLGNAAQMGPTQPVYCDSCATGYYNYSGYPAPSNPVEILNLVTNQGTTYRSIGTLKGEYRMPFLEALSFVMNLGFDVARGEQSVFYPSTLNAQQHGGHGTQYQQNPNNQQSSLETYLNYAAPLNFVPGRIDLTGGYSYQQAHAEYSDYNATGVSGNFIGPNGFPSAQSSFSQLFINEAKLISFFGRANYNYEDRYIVAASLRRDGSSRFGPDNQWASFPSVSGAWRISQERFMQGTGWLSDLKLRASWARTGNQNFADYQQFATYQASNNAGQVQFGNTFVPTLRPNAYDANIQWETTASTNFGLDVGLWDQRLTAAIDVYNKNTDNMIFFVVQPAGTNLSNFATINTGSMNNKGLEFSLGFQAFPGGAKRLGWTLDFTGTHNTNEVQSISGGSTQIPTGGVAGGVGTTIQVIEPGAPINSFFVCRQAYQNGKPLEGQYYNLKGDSVVTGCTNNRRAFHSPAPDWILTHTSYMTYGKFDLSFTLRAYIGNYVYNNVASNLGSYQELARGSPFNLNTSVLESGFMTPQYQSDYYVEDASFLRMDNIQVGYSFNWGSQPLKVFAALQNAFTITGYSGVDPTAGINGIDNNIYPRSRTFTAGLNIRL